MCYMIWAKYIWLRFSNILRGPTLFLKTTFTFGDWRDPLKKQDIYIVYGEYHEQQSKQGNQH